MADSNQSSAIKRWKRDPCAFIREVLVNPENNKPFELYPAQVQFLREALTLKRDGTLPYSELVYSTPKKGGKTATTAMAMLYVMFVLGGRFGEGFCCANDFEQAQGRIFQAIVRIIEASPLLRGSAKISSDKIVFTSTGSVITALASHYASAAGSNPNFITFDELWAYQSTAAERMWDEMIPVPTRAVSARWTATYAGYEGESTLLEGLYKRGLQGEQIGPDLYRNGGLLMLWSHDPVAPWQTQRWLDQMREQHRPNAYLRQVENRWVSSESSFVEMDWWDACTDSDLSPLLAEPNLPVWVGVDASVKRDSTAIVCAAFIEEKVRLVWHRIFQPSPHNPLDFEATIERTLLELRRRFYVKEVRFDPFQLVAVAQRLALQGLPMVEFPQSVPNLTEASSNLYELVKGRNLRVYPDDEIRLAVSRAVALETSRGWRIAKEKQSHKIDVIVALAQAALGAVQQGQRHQPFEYRVAPPPRTLMGEQTAEQIAAAEDAHVSRRSWGVLAGPIRFGRGTW
ncbi:MAG TPA: terminase large subunit [Candidatus Binataceae bacterium]|nr:terminase large subunit [Candidatus Binataceae bacterium]